MKHTRLLTSLSTTAALTLPAIASAAFQLDPSGEIATELGGSLDTSLEPGIFAIGLINAVLGFLGVIALCLVIYGGFTIMTAAGNDDKVQQGRKVLQWAIVGIVLIISSFSILQFLETTLN